jgi:hypothetical protein
MTDWYEQYKKAKDTRTEAIRQRDAGMMDRAAELFAAIPLLTAADECRVSAEALRDHHRITAAITEGRASWQPVDAAEALRARGWR